MNKFFWPSPAFFFSAILHPFNKMSSTLFSNASPFAAALPASHMFFAYDSDGDVIMTDAATGLPITYGGARRVRSASLDSDSADSRPSKRSRTSSDDGDGEDDSGRGGAVSPIKIPRAPVGLPDACPPAPKKAPQASQEDDDEDDGDGNDSVLRNLAEQMAAVVLDGEPRDAPDADGHGGVPPASTGVRMQPPGGEPEAAPEGGWCLSVTCSDLALPLDMRHPRVLLNFLRFVDTYNELAPEGEEIHLPYMDQWAVSTVLSHISVTDPVPEFASEIAELRALVDRYSCRCPDCEPEVWSDREDDSDSDDSYDAYRARRRGSM